VRARGADRDGGFTLVEVIVSLLLLAIVMAAALSLFVRALANTDLQAQRGQAITIANDQLERVRGLPVGDLTDGRTAASVSYIWSWDSALTAGSVAAPDPTATATSVPLVPTIRTQRIDNLDYVVRTLIDTSYLPPTGSTTCGTTVASAKPMYRITVSVAWTTKSGRTCDTLNKLQAGKPNCQEYVVTTLRDQSSEATFNTN
jgi:prepilin-type N-terminal cleavage/methylation domain-containing protein